MYLKKILFIAYILLTSCVLNAQDNSDVTFTMAVSKDKLGLNERLRVDFTMNKDGDNFNPPDFNGFRILMGPSQSISSSWINGVRSYSKSYSYTLSPTKKGTLTIEQSSIVIAGKLYKSLAKKIEVTSAVAAPNSPKTAGDIADENLHLVAEVSKSSPYLNEAVSVIYKLYVSPNISVSNYQPLDNPTFNNFWSQNIKVTDLTAKNGTYKGEPYRYVVLKKVVLYPQKIGKLEIEPLSLDVTVDVPSNRRDFFGSRLYNQTHKVVFAGRRVIDVKPLPLKNKPADFGGAVGDFDFQVSATKTSLNATESLQATVAVSGVGNLKLFKLPILEVPSALEVYDPEFTEEVRTNFSGMQGKIKNAYTVVPAFKGKYPLPPLRFSFFNPKTEKYTTINSKEIIINVLGGPQNTNIPNSDSSANKQGVISSSQFNFIKLQPNLQEISTGVFYKSWRFYLFLLLPALFIPLAILFKQRSKEMANDVVGGKARRASKLSRKYLSKAKKALGNKESFYIALEKALHNYLKAKLKIETTEFSKDSIAALLDKKQINTGTKEGFIELLKNCEAARYSPFLEVQMQLDYDKASDVISTMDKQL